MSAPKPRQNAIGRALRQIGENPWLQVIAVTSLTVAYMIVGVYFTLLINVERQAADFFTGSKLVLVLADNATPQTGANVAKESMNYARVAGAMFVHKDQALQRFRRSLGNRKGLLEGLENNPLPHTVEVILNPGRQEDQGLVEELRGLDGVVDVVTSRPWLMLLEKARRSLISLAAALGILLFLAVTLLAANTVRLAYYARRRELEVLALVGATPGYMRRPFVIEAVLQGMLAAMIAYCGVWVMMWVLSAPGALPFGMDLQSLLQLPPQLPLLLAAVALTSTMAGSWLGVGRVLRRLNL